MHDWWPSWTHIDRFYPHIANDGGVVTTVYEGEQCKCGVLRVVVAGVVRTYHVGGHILKEEPECNEERTG